VGVLAVQVDQLGPRLGQGGHRRHAPVHVRTRPARRGYGAGEHHLPLVDDEAALHERLLGPRAHQHAVGPTPHQQLDGLDQEGLARAGLAGERREARFQDEVGLGDDPEVADAQFGQHC
jgi:hypothetical protein